MLEKIEQELPDLGLTSFKITGSTPAKRERQDMTKAFNQGERDAFLISLKAGGVGLNLTGADTVILVDLWWESCGGSASYWPCPSDGSGRNG